MKIEQYQQYTPSASPTPSQSTSSSLQFAKVPSIWTSTESTSTTSPSSTTSTPASVSTPWNIDIQEPSSVSLPFDPPAFHREIKSLGLTKNMTSEEIIAATDATMNRYKGYPAAARILHSFLRDKLQVPEIVVASVRQKRFQMKNKVNVAKYRHGYRGKPYKARNPAEMTQAQRDSIERRKIEYQATKEKARQHAMEQFYKKVLEAGLDYNTMDPITFVEKEAPFREAWGDKRDYGQLQSKLKKYLGVSAEWNEGYRKFIKYFNVQMALHGNRKFKNGVYKRPKWAASYRKVQAFPKSSSSLSQRSGSTSSSSSCKDKRRGCFSLPWGGRGKRLERVPRGGRLLPLPPLPEHRVLLQAQLRQRRLSDAVFNNDEQGSDWAHSYKQGDDDYSATATPNGNVARKKTNAAEQRPTVGQKRYRGGRSEQVASLKLPASSP